MELTNTNALELWKEALSSIKHTGRDYLDNDERICRELINMILVLKNPENSNIEKPISVITGAKNWVYPSKEELSNIMFKEYQAPIYDYTYGGRIFNFQGKVNQLYNFVIPLLKLDNSSRRAIMVFYDPILDSDINNRNTPGIVYVQFRIIDNKLIISSTIRSNDLFFGWPANLYQIYCLQKLVAKELNVELGNIVTISNSAHFFKDNLEIIEELLGI